MNKELGKFYQKYRLYIFPAAVAVSCLILIIFIIYPQVAKLIQGSRLEQDFSTRSKFLEAKASALENYDEADLQRKVGLVLASFPAEKDFINVMSLLQRLNSQSGFSILSLSLTSVQSSSKDQSYGVKVEIVGPKTLFLSLLNGIESSPRIMRISTIDVTSGMIADVVSATLTVEVFFAQVSDSFGTLDSPLPEISDKDEQLISRLATTQPIITTPISSSAKGRADPFE